MKGPTDTQPKSTPLAVTGPHGQLGVIHCGDVRKRFWFYFFAPPTRNLLFEPTCASCTVGSYVSVCLSVCLSRPRGRNWLHVIISAKLVPINWVQCLLNSIKMQVGSLQRQVAFFYWPLSLAKQEDNGLGSVRPSVTTLTVEPKKSYQSKVFVRVSDNAPFEG